LRLNYLHYNQERQLDPHDDLVFEEPPSNITEEDIENLHRYLDEALEKCGDFCVYEFEDIMDVWEWHKGWG